MIKFTPVQHEVISILKEKEKFVANKQNQSIAAQMDERLRNKSCPDHPDIMSEIEVDFLDEPEKVFTLKSYCCDKFKADLDLICANKRPVQ